MGRRDGGLGARGGGGMALPKEARVLLGVSIGGGTFYRIYCVCGEFVKEKVEEKEQSIHGLVGRVGGKQCVPAFKMVH